MPRIEHIYDENDGTEGKWCGKCEQYMDVSNFCKAKTWDGLRSTCNDCLHAARIDNRSKMTEYNKKYWQKTKVEQTAKHKIWCAENKEYVTTKHKEWRSINGKEHDKKQWQRRKNDPKYKEYHNTYRREYDKMKRKNNPHYKIKVNFMRRLREVIHADSRALHTAELLGCSVEDFKAHLESQFDEKMSWENYSNTGWHIDHIVPCAYFDLTRKSHQRRCFHWSNMQPMWSTENIAKRDSLTEQGEYTWIDLQAMFPEGPDEEDIVSNEELVKLEEELGNGLENEPDDEFEQEIEAAYIAEHPKEKIDNQ